MNADEMNLELCQDLLDTISQQQAEIAELKNSRDYWCLQYKDVIKKLEHTSCELDTRSYLIGKYDTDRKEQEK